MRHIQNDYMKVQMQNALLAKEAAEAAKIRQAERARAQAAEEAGKLPEEEVDPKIKKIPTKHYEEKGKNLGQPQGFQIESYRQEGELEVGGEPGEEKGVSGPGHIDIKA